MQVGESCQPARTYESAAHRRATLHRLAEPDDATRGKRYRTPPICSEVLTAMFSAAYMIERWLLGWARAGEILL
jgi:hypothetical protein